MTFKNWAMQAMDKLVNCPLKTHDMSGGDLPCAMVFRGPNGAAAGVAALHSKDYATWYGNSLGFEVASPWSATFGWATGCWR